MLPKLEKLIAYLDSCQAPVDLPHLKQLLLDTPIARHDVEPMCIFGDETYHRNLVSRSSWYELLVICWRSGQFSPIHDHMGSSCVFKIIQGQATEIICKPTNGSYEGKNLVRPVSKKIYKEGEVCASASAHIHEISNRQPKANDLVTVHVYSPPLKMNIYAFDQKVHDTEQLLVGA